MLPVRDRQEELRARQEEIRDGHVQSIRSPAARATFREMRVRLRGLAHGHLVETDDPMFVADAIRNRVPGVRDRFTHALTELVRDGGSVGHLARELLCLGFWPDLCRLQDGIQIDPRGEWCSEVYVVFMDLIRKLPASGHYTTADELLAAVRRALESKGRKARRKRTVLGDDDDAVKCADDRVLERRRVPVSTHLVAGVPELRHNVTSAMGEADARFFLEATLRPRAEVAAEREMTRGAVSAKLYRLSMRWKAYLLVHHGYVLADDDEEDEQG